ncbi:MAG: cytochrome P450 [Cellvibrionales bacterium]|nr:cytochrome P450 [Cellvibrionales bacterium]
MEMSLGKKIQIGSYSLYKALTSPTFSEYNPDNYDSFCANPYPIYNKILNDKKIFFNPRQAAWVVGGDFETVKSLMHDPRLSIRFSEWKFAPKTDYENMTPLAQLNANLLMSMPPENHSRIRRLASPAFNPRQVENLTPDIQGIVDEKLDAIQGPFNLFEVSSTIPLLALARYIGVPEDFQKEFEGLSLSILSNYDPTLTFDVDLAMAGLEMINGLIDEKKIIAQRLIDEHESLSDTDQTLDDYVAEHTKDFLTSLMIKVIKSDEGQKITEAEALSLVASALAAGADTTLHHVNWAISSLLKNPHVIPEVLADDTKKLLDNAIVEAFRWDNLGHSGSVRFALEDIEIYGQTIKKGEMVRPLNCGTFRDPRMFSNPDVFDIHRDNLKEVYTFGIGPHYCLGAAMAKKITQLTIWSFLKRFPKAKIISKPTFEKHFIIRNMTGLMVDPMIDK